MLRLPPLPALGSPLALYYTALVLLLLALLLSHRLVHARFGMVLQGARVNERRMKAMGFATTRYKLLAYVVSCVLCGLAGLLYGNLTGFAAPAYLAWTVSGEIIVMVVLGGMGTVLGPVVGALTLLVTEEILKAITEHWMLILGPLFVLVVLGTVGYFGGFALILRLLRRIFHTLATGDPFHPTNVSRLKQIGLTLATVTGRMGLR